MTETILGAFDLNQEVERFPPGDGGSGRRAETLIKTDQLRVVLVTMRQGAELHQHTAPGPITIQALRGSFEVRVNDDDHALPQGSLISIAVTVPHAVRAREAGAFLLTIAWQPGASGEPAATQGK